MILLDFRCRSCGEAFESLERRPPPAETGCECGGTADRIVSAVHFKQQLASAAKQGAPEEPPPGAMDTRALAEGQRFSEWKRERRKGLAKRRLDEVVRGDL